MSAPHQYYDDGHVQLDREAITLRRYHFPSGTSKVIPLRNVRGYKAQPLGLFTHRFRIWGSRICAGGYPWTCGVRSSPLW